MHGHFPVPVVRRFHGLRKHTELLAHYSIRFNLTTRFSRHENLTDSQNSVRRSSANTLSPSFCPSQPHNVSQHLINTFAKVHNPPAQYTNRVALRTVVSRSHWLCVVGQHRWKQVSRCASNTLTTAKRTTIWFYITCGVIRSELYFWRGNKARGRADVDPPLGELSRTRCILRTAIRVCWNHSREELLVDTLARAQSDHRLRRNLCGGTRKARSSAHIGMRTRTRSAPRGSISTELGRYVAMGV
jgi:hypothetical protein